MTSDDPQNGAESETAQSRALRQGAAALSAASKQAQQAMDSAKDLVAGAHLDEVGARAAETATNLYRGGRDLLANNEDLSNAADNLSSAVRKNPLAAIGIAFSAGIVLALLTRG